MTDGESNRAARTVPLPESLAARALAFLAGEGEAAVPRHSATVLLLRDQPEGMQVYLLRRTSTMAFAAGFHAFPGGALDPRDTELAIGWAGPPPRDWAGWFGCDEAHARALLCAAVRETFEESGVLLAGPDEHSVVADVTGADWEADRLALVEHRASLAELLHRRGLVLRSDLLAGWARWITPEFEPRRYDTAFFLAELPTGQTARDVSGEADLAEWVWPATAIAEHEAGRAPMLPPTLSALAAVAGFTDAASAVAAARAQVIRPVLPQLRQGEDGQYYLDFLD
ncbi:MAG TPA: NUDIX hydrolase [Actinocrinis sp.]|nr:NUDIX hydrolase [Actinocrinis sp.]